MNSFNGTHLSSVFVIGFLVVTTSCMHMESLVAIKENLRLKGNVMRRQPTSSQLSCAHLCLRKDGCLSFNYKLSSNTKGLCELSSGTAGRFDGGLSDGAGWIYGQIQNKTDSGKNFQISDFYFRDFLS